MSALGFMPGFGKPSKQVDRLGSIRFFLTSRVDYQTGDIGAEEKDLYEVLTSTIFSCVFNSPFSKVLEDAVMEFVMKVGDGRFEARSLLLKDV